MLDRPWNPGLTTYLVVGALYVSAGVTIPDLLYSSIVGLLVCVLGVWALPELARRLLLRFRRR